MQLKAVGRLTDLQCDMLDAYSVTYLNKSCASHQISAMADLALSIGCKRVLGTAGILLWRVMSGY